MTTRMGSLIRESQHGGGSPRPAVSRRERLPSSAATRSARPRRPDPRSGSAPPTPSSATSTTAWPLARSTRDPRLRGLRVLDHVGERLGDDEVGRGLDRGRQPLRRHAGQLDGTGERPASASSAARRPRSERTPGGCRGRARAAPRARAGAPPARRRSSSTRPCPGRCAACSGRRASRARARRAAAGRRRAGCAPAGGARRCRPRRSGRARRAAPRRGRAAAPPGARSRSRGPPRSRRWPPAPGRRRARGRGRSRRRACPRGRPRSRRARGSPRSGSVAGRPSASTQASLSSSQ